MFIANDFNNLTSEETTCKLRKNLTGQHFKILVNVLRIRKTLNKMKWALFNQLYKNIVILNQSQLTHNKRK